MHEIYDVFDASGKKSGTATWRDVHSKGLIHQTVSVLIFNSSKSEILVQKRSSRMQQRPGLWQHSAGGHVLAGQTLEDGIRKELQEELFAKRKLPEMKIKKIAVFLNEDEPDNREILHLFEAVYPGPFSCGEEVEKVKWIKWAALLKDMKKNPAKYTRCFHNIVSEYTKAARRR